ncbi:MAG TPA: hypothetical protein VGV93_01735 [Acidimicrobiales bacterium]|nr:hypothetical protein [Acidimicrobiales bacterium]
MNPLPARPSSRLAALVVCGLLSATACSDDGGDDAANGDQGELAANARAAAVNVQLTDLPEGYLAVPPDDTEGNGAMLDGCVEDLDEVTVAEAESPTFQLQSGDGINFVASETSVLSDSEPAARLLDSVADQAVLDCLSQDLGEVLSSILPGATTETSLALAPDPDFPDVGDERVHVTGTATFTRPDEEPISISASLAFVQTDDVLSVLLFGGIREPFPPETLRSVAAAVAERQSAERQS